MAVVAVVVVLVSERWRGGSTGGRGGGGPEKLMGGLAHKEAPAVGGCSRGANPPSRPPQQADNVHPNICAKIHQL